MTVKKVNKHKQHMLFNKENCERSNKKVSMGESVGWATSSNSVTHLALFTLVCQNK